MQRFAIHIKSLGIILAILLFSAHHASGQSSWAELVIVGNKTGQTEMKPQEARKIFLAKTTNWPNKSSVSIALPSPKSSSAEPVARLIYGTRPASVQKFWLSIVFQGRATPPYFFDTDQELIQFIQKTPGAIGAVSANTQIPQGVSIISIQN
jgi:ABC-type phosphate transport system substrate-binding protein